MNVVVSAIVDPWVTTLSFVVALAMKIQDAKKYDFPEKATLISEAKQLASDEIDFGENWIFCYEVLDANDFPQNVCFAADWKKIKEDGITFIDNSLI